MSCASEGLSPPRFAFKNAFAEATRPLRLGQVTGIAAGADRTLYLIHRGSNTFFSTKPMAEPAIVRLSESGHLLGTLPNTAPFVVPHGLAIDHHHSLWATDVATHRVYRLDATTGAVQLTLGRGSAGAGAAAFNKPTDVAVSERTDEVYVADGYGNSRIAVFSYAGRFLREWGSRGRGPGQFQVGRGVGWFQVGRGVGWFQGGACDLVALAPTPNARPRPYPPPLALAPPGRCPTRSRSTRATRSTSPTARTRACRSSPPPARTARRGRPRRAWEPAPTTCGRGTSRASRTTSSSTCCRWSRAATSCCAPPRAACSRRAPCACSGRTTLWCCHPLRGDALVLAGASVLVVVVAEMEAHRLMSFASTSEVEEDGGLVY